MTESTAQNYTITTEKDQTILHCRPLPVKYNGVDVDALLAQAREISECMDTEANQI